MSYLNSVNPDSIVIIEQSQYSTISAPNTSETDLVDEWSVVPKIEAKFQDDNSPQQQDNASAIQSSRLIDFNTAYNEFVKLYLTNEFLTQSQKDLHQQYSQENFVHKVISKIFGPQKIRKEYRQNREFIYLLATKQLDDNVLIHKQILTTLYRKLTDSSVDCPRFGTHWERIGFQGTDPATDLRGCGILSLILTLYLFEDSKISSLTQDIYKLSLHETQNFPFFVMGINLIRILLQVMHSNKLNSFFNKSNGKVIDTCGQFYAAFYLELYLQWKNKNKTIKDSGFVLRDIEMKAKKSPKYFITQLDKYIKKQQTTSKKQSAYKFANVPKIVIQRADSTDQDFTRLDM